MTCMVSGVQQAIAVWAVLVVPFVLMVAYLWTQRELTLGFVIAYWFPVVVVTALGVVPPPWAILTE